MTPSKNIDQLLKIMAMLRDPETGCPWDVEQDFNSIIPYTIEEVYEVADAIQRGDRIDLCDELGDLLLQVVYYARLAEEEGSFNFGDVVFAITKKMLRRHPHVFGSKEQRQIGLLKGQWEDIKSQEKAERIERRQAAGLADDTKKGFLAKVKTAQPPEKEAKALQEKAATVGFDWATPQPIFDKMNEEIGELKEAISLNDRDQIEAELGDIYFVLINLARKLDIDPQKALLRTNQKFRNRFDFIEKSLAEENKPLTDADLQELETLWDKAKTKK